MTPAQSNSCVCSRQPHLEQADNKWQKYGRKRACDFDSCTCARYDTRTRQLDPWSFHNCPPDATGSYMLSCGPLGLELVSELVTSCRYLRQFQAGLQGENVMDYLVIMWTISVAACATARDDLVG